MSSWYVGVLNTKSIGTLSFQVGAKLNIVVVLMALLFVSNSNAENPNQPKATQQVFKQPLLSNTKTVAAPKASFPTDIRKIDGSENNSTNRVWGQASRPLRRMVLANYADGKQSMVTNRPSPRFISNAVNKADARPPRGAPVSDMFWQWGQFLDHDLSLSPELIPTESADIAVPSGDAWFDPQVSGDKVIPFDRSAFSLDTTGVRQQLNNITAYIDASHVYGSDDTRANALRANDGSGKLKTSAGQLLPFNTSNLPNAPNSTSGFFLAGDFRANEQIGLTAMHTVFMREHNRLATETRAANAQWSGDRVYEYARALVGAQIQWITYNEFLPKLIGRDALSEYSGYNSQVDASIANEFSTAAYRVGHTMLSSQLLRVDAQGNEATIRLRDAFFSPNEIVSNGIDSVLRGLGRQRAQKVDVQIVDDVRNMLFGAPGSGGLDLASLNIQRGRDHGIPGYNQTRTALGLSPAADFNGVTADMAVVQKLQNAYTNIGELDLWIGGLAEAPAQGAMVGPTFRAILSDQFQRLRDGDRFWYQSYLTTELVEWVEDQSLTKIIRRNTGIGNELSDDVFAVPSKVPVGAIMLLLLDE